MGVIVRPVEVGDLKHTYGQVSNVLERTPIEGSENVDDPAIFGYTQSLGKSDFQNVGIYNRKGYISLAMPVVNFFLTGLKLDVLKSILQEDDIVNIANGSYVFDKSRECRIPIGDCKDLRYTSNILIGGDYIKYLIDKLDVKKEIEYELLTAAFKSIEARKRKNLGIENIYQVATVQEGSGDFWVIDNYYLNMKVVDYKNNEFYQKEVRDRIIEGLLKYNSRLTYLLSLRESKSRLEGLILNELVVLPIGYRPTLDKRRDPLTKAYNRIVKCNRDLQNTITYSNSDIDSVRVKYIDLVNECKCVLKDNSNTYYKTLKPIADILKGKTGLIRDKMQGVRTDFSGRSVITVDPNMSIDTVGIPLEMAEKLFQMKLLEEYKPASGENKADLFLDKKKTFRLNLTKRLLDDEYIVIGRQPTLFYLGLKGFKVKIVDGNAIVINPLCTPSFNADFDGDQMWDLAPVSPEAKREVRTILNSMNNLFLPRNGECHITPRQEILYGIWKACNTDNPEKCQHIKIGKSKVEQFQIIEDIIMQRINVYDELDVEGTKVKAGIYGLKVCLGSRYSKYKIGVLPLTTEGEDRFEKISEKWFKALFKVIILNNVYDFKRIVNLLVKYGFGVANIFPPNISVLDAPDVSKYQRAFDDKVRERQELFDLGFETEESFTAFYDKAYADFSKEIKKAVKSQLTDDNGFVEMVESGARGNDNNLMLLFGMKGRVMKSDDEAFNAIIRCPLVDQLTGLEHEISAYGSRKGLVDKTINTYTPGYITRKMEHTNAVMSIVTEDCGTKNGLLITYDGIKEVLPAAQFTGDVTADNNMVKKYFSKMIVGRYVVGVDAMIPNTEEAGYFYDQYVASVDKTKNELTKKRGLKLRSPITCERPCCQKCYGLDLCTNRTPAVGLPIGFIAAQSIGEPGTQLTMKNFQSGGIAGQVNLTSSFDVMNQYLHILDLKKRSEDGPILYDYIAPCEGDLVTVSRGTGAEEVRIMDYNNKGEYVNKLRASVLIPAGTELKSHVKRGDSIYKVQGDMSIKELMKYRTVEEAQSYLILKLYSIFEREVEVDLKHFEVVAACMTFRVCLKGNEYFKTGLFYTTEEYWNHDREGCQFTKTIKGIADVPFYRNDVFSTIFMQDIGKGISRSIITSGYDSLTNPMIRTSFGLNPGIGSDVSGYIEGRSANVF